MPTHLEELIRQWNGVGVVCRYDPEARAWMFICLHDDSLGPCTGGTRLAVYDSPASGLRDAMRLAEGMTFKWAALDEPVGGGKAVIAPAVPLQREQRRLLLLRYGDLVESLHGIFRTGEDLGTDSSDMQILAERTQYVHGFHPRDGSKVNPSPFTARGVFAGIKSAALAVWGTADLDGRSVLVQGAGNVGLSLARLLAGVGARLLVSDTDPERVAAASRELRAEVVAPDRFPAADCDIYAPCAVGATLDETTIPLLRCRIVAGSANNQLAQPADAQRLHRRGILYVPDYIINAGGALSFALLDRGIHEEEQLFRQMDTIGETVRDLLGEAAERNESPVAAAERRAERVLARARGEI